MSSGDELDFGVVMAEVDLLSSTVDPERNPFKSKYAAVDKLVRLMSSETRICALQILPSSFLSPKTPNPILSDCFNLKTALGDDLEKKLAENTDSEAKVHDLFGDSKFLLFPSHY